MYLYTCYNCDYDIINHNDDTNSNDSNILKIITANTIKIVTTPIKIIIMTPMIKITMNYLMIKTLIIIINQ